MKIKKILTSVIAGAGLLGLVGMADASNDINLYGASAQHEFWRAAVPAWMQADVGDGGLGCDIAIESDADSKNVIVMGTNCNNPIVTGGTINVRYTSKNSSYGIGAACNMAAYSDPDCEPGETKMCVGDDDGCTTLDCYNVTLGSSDVQLTSFTQTTPTGFNQLGATPELECRKSVFPSDEFIAANCDTVLTRDEQSVVVPFGFAVNNNVTQARCTAPGPVGPNAEHKAYSHWGWQCIPDANGYSEDCIGYYKCEDGLCADGSGACESHFDCPDAALEDTTCTAMPIDNLSRLQVLLIFSEGNNATKLTNWNQFGPWYPDLTIHRCMRCAGSGTHATFDLQVLRGDVTVKQDSVMNAFNHHTSSTRLQNCIEKFDGGVGYLDADKPLVGANQIHIVKYQGVEPTRAKIENCQYNFWAAQHLYGINAEISDLELDEEIDSLIAFTNASSTLDLLGSPKNDFWAAQGDMKCEKFPGERDFPRVR